MARGHYMIDEDESNNSCHEHVQTTTTLESEEIIDNNEEEKEEQIEPPSTPNLSNDKEVNIEAHSFIIIPLETHHKHKASAPQCLKEPSYVKVLKDLRTQARKSSNHLSKKFLRSK
jgi:predicted nucleic-acid-binding protein